MKLTKLLAATSVAALMAGAAHAQLKLEQLDTVVGATIPDDYKIANEVDFDELTKNTATIGLVIGTQGLIPPGQNLFLTLEISGPATFGVALDGSEVVTGQTGAVVTADGGADDISVQYLITTDAGKTGTPPSGFADMITLAIPVEVTGCGSVSFSVTQLQTEAVGTKIEGGAAALTATGKTAATNAITCVDAFTASVAVDADETLLSFSKNFQEFNVAGPDAATLAVLGELEFDVDTTVYVDMSKTFAAPTQVDGYTMAINFSDATGLVDADAVPDGADTLFNDAGKLAGNVITIDSTNSPATKSETGTVTLEVDGVDTVAKQVVTVSSAVLKLDSSIDLKATDNFLAKDVEDLVYDGQLFGPFDWVNSAGQVNSIFRITGLPDDELFLSGRVILDNSTGTCDTVVGDCDGVYTFQIDPDDVANGEERISSKSAANGLDLVEIVGQEFGTADVTLVFSNGNNLDVDRLNSSSATAVVTPYGDAANLDIDPTPGDGDNDAVAQPTVP